MPRKTIIPILLLSLLLIGLSGCGTSTSGTGNDNTAQDSTCDTTTLDLERKLLVGMLKLEDTGLALTPAQAADMLPYWQAILSLEKSGVAADEEISSVVEQISSFMNSDQIAMIEKWNLTVQDETALMITLGITNDSTASVITGQTNHDGPVLSGPGVAISGNSPADIPPLEINVTSDMPSGGSLGSSVNQSSIVQGSGDKVTSCINGFPTILLEALINLLQERAQE